MQSSPDIIRLWENGELNDEITSVHRGRGRMNGDDWQLVADRFRWQENGRSRTHR